MSNSQCVADVSQEKRNDGITHEQHTITITIDALRLDAYTDAYIAQCWHLAQANPAPHGDEKAGQLVERLSYEIVRRWMSQQPAELYSHQPKSHYRQTLSDNGLWIDDVWTPNHKLPADILQRHGRSPE